MTLSTQAREYMAKRDELLWQERIIVDSAFSDIYTNAYEMEIPAAKDDRAAELEAALIKFIIESRK